MSYNSEHQPVSLPEMQRALRAATWAYNKNKLTKWRRLLRTAIRSEEALQVVEKQLREANLRIVQLQWRGTMRSGDGSGQSTPYAIMASRQAGKTETTRRLVSVPASPFSWEPFLSHFPRAGKTQMTASRFAQWARSKAAPSSLSSDDLESAGMEGTEAPEIDWSKFLLPSEVPLRDNSLNLRRGQVWTHRYAGKSTVYRITQINRFGFAYEVLAGDRSAAGYAGTDAPRIANAVMVCDDNGRWEPGFSAAGIATNADFEQFSRYRGLISKRDNTPNIAAGQTWLRNTVDPAPDGVGTYVSDIQVVRFTGDFGNRFQVLILKSRRGSKIEGEYRLYLKSRLDTTMARAVMLRAGDAYEPQFVSRQGSTAASYSRAA